MLLKDLIDQLQKIYDTYDRSYKDVAGEPEIMIDMFAKKDVDSHDFFYAGFSKEIDIEHSADGVYLIFNRFANDTRPND
jgi:hypothetical protein